MGRQGNMGEESQASTGPRQMDLENGILDGGNYKQRKDYAELKPSHAVNDGEIQQESRQEPWEWLEPKEQRPGAPADTRTL